MATLRRRKLKRSNHKSFSKRSIYFAWVLLGLTAIVVAMMLFMKQKIISNLPVTNADRELYRNHEKKDSKKIDPAIEYDEQDREYLNKIINNH